MLKIGTQKGLIIFALAFQAQAASAQSSKTSDVYDGISQISVNCIITNLQHYIDTGRRIVIIRPDICPSTDIFAGAEKGRTNMLPGKSFYEKPKSSGPRVATVIYTQDQLKCLQDLATLKTLTSLPRKPCGRE